MLDQLQLKTVYALIHLSEALKSAESEVEVRIGEGREFPGIADTAFGDYGAWLKESATTVRPLHKGIKSVIDAMTKPEKAELLALVWSGRDGEKYSELLDVAYDKADEDTGGYLSDKPLALYLRTALETLGMPLP